MIIQHNNRLFEAEKSFKYIATDSDGEVYVFTKKPKYFPDSGMWNAKDGENECVGRHYTKNPEKSLKKITKCKSCLIEYQGRKIVCPKGFKYIATDSDGEVYVFTKKPIFEDDWSCEQQTYKLPYEKVAEFIGDFEVETSLEKIKHIILDETNINKVSHSIKVYTKPDLQDLDYTVDI